MKTRFTGYQRLKTCLCYLLATLGFTLNTAFAAVDFEVTLDNPPGEGFNDTTPVTPIGGNTGLTLGEQRVIALGFALNIISESLSSSIPIQLAVKFDQFDLNSSYVILGTAGPNFVHSDLVNTSKQNTYFPIALANRLTQEDVKQNPLVVDENIDSDIEAQFESSLDTNPLIGFSWYYGLDGNPGEKQIDFVSVVLHEMLHGLGFISTLDYEIDAANQPLSPFAFGLTDVFTDLLQHRYAAPPGLTDMTPAQRAIAITSSTGLQWGGLAGRFASSRLTTGVNGYRFQLYAPSSFDEGSSVGHSSPDIDNDLMRPNYIGANHNLGLGAAALADMGWGNYVDLTLSVQLATQPQQINVPYDLILHITNNGVQDAPSSTLTYTLPSNTSLVSGDASCQNNAGEITCNLNTISKRDRFDLVLTLQTTQATDIIHTAHLQSDSVEANPSNNASSITSTFNVSSNLLTADAGADMTTTSGSLVTLSASQSQANEDVSYAWTQISGPSVTLNHNDTENVTFTAPKQGGVATFLLTLTDSQYQTATDTVSVIINALPIADAGPDQTTASDATVQLNGSESSDDSAIVSYHWQQTSGFAVEIDNANSPIASFISPSLNGTLVFQLTVTDDQGASTSDTVVMNTQANDKKGGASEVGLVMLSLMVAIARRRRYQLT